MSSKLILGTVQFGLNYGINNTQGKPAKEDVFKVLSYAYEKGIRYLDTAELYGDAHEIIGQFHILNPDKKFNIITKFPHEFNGELDSKISIYLNQLNVNNLSAILFHSFDSYKLHKSQISSKLTGVEKIGVSIYTNEQMNEVIDDVNVDIIQLPFNLFDNINLRGELLKKAKTKNKIIHTRSAFLQGLFFMNKGNPNKIVVKLKKELEFITNLSERSSISVGSLALNYCLNQSDIDGVLIGVDSLEQLKENIAFLDNEIKTQYFCEIEMINIQNCDLLNPSLWNSLS
jgi:aryl-alcohol dehydrogenase-like predicted oxidoreductase